MPPYIVTIKVSDASVLAGTGSNISANLTGELGSSGFLVVDPKTSDNFEKGNEDPATVMAPFYLGDLTKIAIRSDRHGPQSDALFAYVTVTDPSTGLSWQGNNPDPSEGFIEDKNGGTYYWPLRQIDPDAHRKFVVDKQEKDIEARIAENQKRIDNARKQSEGKTNEDLAKLQARLDQADNDYKRAQIEKQIETADRKAKAANKGFVAAKELSPDGIGGLFVAMTAEESIAEDSPHPGVPVAGENYLEWSGGQMPGRVGLARAILAYRNGQIVPAVAEVAQVTEAAAQGQQWALGLLTQLGIPKPTKQRTIFDLFLGR